MGVGVGVGVGEAGCGEKMPLTPTALVLLTPKTDTAALTKECVFVSTTKSVDAWPGVSPDPAKVNVMTFPVASRDTVPRAPVPLTLQKPLSAGPHSVAPPTDSKS